MAIYIVLMLAVCVLDQLTKQWAVVVLMEKGSIPVIDGALHFIVSLFIGQKLVSSCENFLIIRPD